MVNGGKIGVFISASPIQSQIHPSALKSFFEGNHNPPPGTVPLCQPFAPSLLFSFCVIVPNLSLKSLC
jgi:hypothetical protein